MDAILDYYKWLCNRIAFSEPVQYGYECLCQELMKIPFEATMFEDSLRIEEALYLRREFARTIGGEKRSFFRSLGRVSFLEILVILVEQMSFMLYGMPLVDNSPSALFLELLDNAGFGYLKDETFKTDHENAMNELTRITDMINQKTYEDNGEGGFFPLENPSCDVRELGLMQQMDAYLIEKYDILN